MARSARRRRSLFGTTKGDVNCQTKYTVGRNKHRDFEQLSKIATFNLDQINKYQQSSIKTAPIFKKRMIVSTTDKWGKNAEAAILNQQIPVVRLRVQDLAESPVDWSQFSLQRPQDIKLKLRKEIRPQG